MRRIGLGRATVRCAFAVAIAGYALVGFFSVTGHAGQAREVTAAGSYSDAQAMRGKQLYADQCVACHGEMLEGVVGPPLTGDDFLTDFGGHPVADLIQKIQGTMPQQAPGTLTRPQSTEITAYILQFNKYPAGPDLTDATAAQFTLPAGKAAPAAAPPVAGGGAQGIPLNVATNLAEFMRGITFPNANVIFNAQIKSPAEDKPKTPIPFDYVLWGRTQYYGWQAVDEAIAALKETTPLMLMPGRRCQNGRAVPIQNADYQKAVADLIAFTDQLKEIAAKRDADKLSEAAEALNNTCANCHKVYRDVTPTGSLQSSSAQGGIVADRCNPNPKVDPNARGL
jgi:mono/diheme cytochrome c family protein